MSNTKFWKGSKQSKVLIIGHDPRLQNSNTEAEYCFFANYFFKDKPTAKYEIAKYELAASVFNYISYLTSDKYSFQEYVITNLCNQFIASAPKGKTVLIPEQLAKDGIEEIRSLLYKSKIELIFAMSTQVNYWLQKLGFSDVDENFLSGATPTEAGIKNSPKYYQAKKSTVFQSICGKRFIAENKYPLYPILHSKNWPLTGRFKEKYEQCFINLLNDINK